MKKKFLIISIILVLIFSTLLISYASSDVPVWAPASSNIVGYSSEDDNVSQNLIDAVKNSNNKISNNTLNTNSSNTMKSQSNNTVDTSSTNMVNSTSANTITDSEKVVQSNNTVNDNPLQLTSGSAVLIEQTSGEVLYDYNMHEKLRPASVTKVMTVLLIMEALDSGRISLTDKVHCSENAHNMGGSQIWLDTREELTVDEMLKAICVVSANDCTVAMAELLEGSEEAFVMKMNEKAKELGMNDTTFKNCHGIDEEGHLTSSYDIALMSRELLTKHPAVTKYTTIYMDSLRDGKSQLVNTNKLVRNYEGCTGLKTGSTSVALFNLSASATRNDLSLIAVIMKAETSAVRFAEARKLLDYGFSNYQYKALASKNEVAGVCNVEKGLKNTTEAVFSKDFGLVMKKSNSNDIEQNIEIYDNVFAPISIGQKIGEVTFTSNGEKLATVDLVANENIDKFGFGTMTNKIFLNWFSLLRV